MKDYSTLDSNHMILLNEFDELNKKHSNLIVEHDSLKALHVELETIYKNLETFSTNLDCWEYMLRAENANLKNAKKILQVKIDAFKENKQPPSLEEFCNPS